MTVRVLAFTCNVTECHSHQHQLVYMWVVINSLMGVVSHFTVSEISDIIMNVSAMCMRARFIRKVLHLIIPPCSEFPSSHPPRSLHTRRDRPLSTVTVPYPPRSSPTHRDHPAPTKIMPPPHTPRSSPTHRDHLAPTLITYLLPL